MDPAWSGDGSRVYYVSWSDEGPDVVYMNPDGSGRTPLAQRSGVDLSPQASLAYKALEGQPIAYHSMAPNQPNIVQVWRMNADGTDTIQLTDLAESSASPQWSPGRLQHSLRYPPGHRP